MHFPYTFKPNAGPFRVHAIYHDDRSTFIRLDATELPALYELKDDNVQVENGVLIVPKILDSGYLAIGKRRFFFNRRAQ